MKKALISLLTIGGVAVIAFAASQAFFSDTETSKGNVLEAGAIDLKVDYEGYYNKPVDNNPNAGFWTLKDLTSAEKFFDLKDLKPGDYGEGTISLHVYNNDAWGCVNVIPTHNDDFSSTEPELEVDVANTDSLFDGELAQNMKFKIWADVCDGKNPLTNGNFTGAEPGDNIYQAGCDRLLTEGIGPITPTTWAIADSTHPNVFTGVGPLVGSNDYFLGVAWEIPVTVGNIIQTDKYQADISFYVVQSRNNDTFKCSDVSVEPKKNTLRLENEVEVQGGPWTVVVDNKYVDLTYNSSGPTFDYTLVGQGLAPSTEYALIYYADGWPGNNPGALIGKHTTDAGGTLNVALVNKELNMDLPTLPDGNFAIGAKIWLIPSSAYNDATKSVIVWPPDFNTWFFEGNVYIHYDDTEIP